METENKSPKKPAKKKASKATTKNPKEEPAQNVSFLVTADSMDIGKMTLYRGWKGPIPLDKAKTLEELGKGKITGI